MILWLGFRDIFGEINLEGKPERVFVLDRESFTGREALQSFGQRRDFSGELQTGFLGQQVGGEW